MISQSAEYALRAAVCLAGASGQPLTNQEIADQTSVPADYLAKILKILSRAGIVTAIRGTNGGFVLTEPADQLSMLRVVQIIDPSGRITTCPLGLKSHGANLCALHRRLDQAIESMEQLLADTSIADLLAEWTQPELGDRCGVLVQPRDVILSVVKNLSAIPGDPSLHSG